MLKIAYFQSLSMFLLILFTLCLLMHVKMFYVVNHDLYTDCGIVYTTFLIISLLISNILVLIKAVGK